MIYHIATRSDWEDALRAGAYTADSLQTEGFIHCSTRAQVLAVANRLYLGCTDLMLLSIDEIRFELPIRYENLEGGTERFPHVYAAIPLTAIVQIYPLTPMQNGSFQFPPNDVRPPYLRP
ncbi:MAG: DUF952 domain-containing protein [Anaerolineales bacterium]|nr:DUF952 domain-containing protein [Anaerolineales bacterium]